MTQAASSPQDPRARGVGAAAGRVVLACIAVVLVIGVSGAAREPYEMVAWLTESICGALCGLLAARWLVPHAWYTDALWAAALLIAAAVTLPVSGVVLAFLIGFRHQPFNLLLVRQILPQVFATSLVMTALAFLVRRNPTQTHAAPKDAPPAKFLARLPTKLKGADIFAVEAEDHYLRLHTSLGQDLILMRLSDAIAELEGIEGAQTHRSWWVAREAVAEVERGDGRAVLTLKNGTQAPVSRGYARTLRAAGWF